MGPGRRALDKRSSGALTCVPMHRLPPEELTDFPALGARARQWRRFEDGLHAWLDTPEGQFVTWCARRELEDTELAAGARR